jgi:hypothetical protein
MQTETFLLPAVATVALGAALLVPLRDDRRFKHATPRHARRPMRTEFGPAGAASNPPAPAAQGARPEAMAPESAGRGHTFDVLCRAVARWTKRPRAGGDAVREAAAGAPRELVSERSFADELAALVTAPSRVDAAILPDAIATRDDVAMPARDDVTMRAREDATMAARDGATSVVAAHDATAHAGPIHDVLARVRPRYERVAPLTRLPLRVQARHITWPELVDPALANDGRAARHALLARMAAESGGSRDAVLAAAYREEDAAGRLLALRALLTGGCGAGTTAIFEEALGVGTDEERALAVDALASCGAREPLERAFGDRVEAIAAKAALAYVGTSDADDYRRALAPHVDAARIEAILALLAGYVA